MVEDRVDEVSVPVSLFWNFVIVREGFKTVERNWNINKVSNFTAGTCTSHELIRNTRSEHPSNLDPFQI